MEFSLNHAFNATEEIADAGNYPDLRLFTAAHAVADSPQQDVADKTAGAGAYANSSWGISGPGAFCYDASCPAGASGFTWFSAICFLFGRDIYNSLDGKVPIGLVASDWGGQAIEVFSSPDALADKTCGGTVTANSTTSDSHDNGHAIGPVSRPSADGVGTSQLWYGMIQPFTRMRFTGAVWVRIRLLPLATNDENSPASCFLLCSSTKEKVRVSTSTPLMLQTTTLTHYVLFLL